MHVNKTDFFHQLVPGPENNVIVSHFKKNIDVLNLRVGGTHQISCDSSLYEGCFPINKGTPQVPWNCMFYRKARKAWCLLETKLTWNLQKHLLHKVTPTFEHQKILLLRKKAMKDRLHREFKEEPIHHPMGICWHIRMRVCMYEYNFIHNLYKA